MIVLFLQFKLQILKQKTSNKIKNLKRENIYLIQTPQAFNYKKLFSNFKIIKVKKLLMMQIYL